MPEQDPWVPDAPSVKAAAQDTPTMGDSDPWIPDAPAGDAKRGLKLKRQSGASRKALELKNTFEQLKASGNVTGAHEIGQQLAARGWEYGADETGNPYVKLPGDDEASNLGARSPVGTLLKEGNAPGVTPTYNPKPPGMLEKVFGPVTAGVNKGVGSMVEATGKLLHFGPTQRLGNRIRGVGEYYEQRAEPGIATNVAMAGGKVLPLLAAGGPVGIGVMSGLEHYGSGHGTTLPQAAIEGIKSGLSVGAAGAAAGAIPMRGALGWAARTGAATGTMLTPEAVASGHLPTAQQALESAILMGGLEGMAGSRATPRPRPREIQRSRPEMATGFETPGFTEEPNMMISAPGSQTTVVSRTPRTGIKPPDLGKVARPRPPFAQPGQNADTQFFTNAQGQPVPFSPGAGAVGSEPPPFDFARGQGISTPRPTLISGSYGIGRSQEPVTQTLGSNFTGTGFTRRPAEGGPEYDVSARATRVEDLAQEHFGQSYDQLEYDQQRWIDDRVGEDGTANPVQTFSAQRRRATNRPSPGPDPTPLPQAPTATRSLREPAPGPKAPERVIHPTAFGGRPITILERRGQHVEGYDPTTGEVVYWKAGSKIGSEMMPYSGIAQPVAQAPVPVRPSVPVKVSPASSPVRKTTASTVVQDIPEDMRDLVDQYKSAPQGGKSTITKVGDSVSIVGRPGTFTVADTSDPSLLTLKTSKGVQLKVGRKVVTPATSPTSEGAVPADMQDLVSQFKAQGNERDVESAKALNAREIAEGGLGVGPEDLTPAQKAKIARDLKAKGFPSMAPRKVAQRLATPPPPPTTAITSNLQPPQKVSAALNANDILSRFPGPNAKPTVEPKPKPNASQPVSQVPQEPPVVSEPVKPRLIKKSISQRLESAPEPKPGGRDITKLDTSELTDAELKHLSRDSKIYHTDRGSDVRAEIAWRKDKSQGGFLGTGPKYFSRAEKIIDTASQGSYTPQQLKGYLKARGAKDSELRWSGLDDLISERAKTNTPISKAEVLAKLAENKIQIKEVTHGGEADKARREAGELGTRASTLRYGDMPIVFHLGGENKREFLLTIPPKELPPVAQFDNWAKDQGWEQQADHTGTVGSVFTNARGESKHYNDLYSQWKKTFNTGDNYRSSHWDELNPIANVLMSEHNHPTKGKGLVVHETQSDWAAVIRNNAENMAENEGLSKDSKEFKSRVSEIINSGEGTNSPNNPKTAARLARLNEIDHEIEKYDEAIVNRRNEMSGLDYVDTEGIPRSKSRDLNSLLQSRSQLRLEKQDINNALLSSVPDMPYTKTWPAMVMRRLIRMAADEGKSWIGWTTGESKADAYDLRKHVDSLQVREHPSQKDAWGYDRKDVPLGETLYTLTGFKSQRLGPIEDLGDPSHPEHSEYVEYANERNNRYRARLLDSADEEYVHGPNPEDIQPYADTVLTEHNLTRKELEEYVGKEVAARLIAQPLTDAAQLLEKYPTTREPLTGLDLKVGGGSKDHLYDEQFVNIANNIGKKYGTQTSKTSIDTAPFYRGRNSEEELIGSQAWLESHGVTADPSQAKPVEIHSLDITPQMAKDAQETGQELFPGQRGAIAPELLGIPQIVNVAKHAKELYDDFRRFVAPVGRTPESRYAANVIREHASQKEVNFQRTAQSLDPTSIAKRIAARISGQTIVETAGDQMAKASPAERVDFIYRLERGILQARAQWQPFADQMRRILDDRRTQVQNLGIGKLANYYENYFPHIWKDPTKAVAFVEQFMAKRPFEGSKRALKERTYPTISDGLAAGLELETTNPVDTVLMHVRDLDRYIMAHKVVNEYSGNGLIRQITARDKVPQGFAKIDDSMMTIWAPPNRRGGISIQGYHIAPEPVATILNNFLSPGLANAKAKGVAASYRGYRSISNAMNAAQLGLSAFHLGFVTMDAATSKLALSFNMLANGHPVAAVTKALGVPLAPISYFMEGSKLMKELYAPGTQGQGISDIFDGLVAGGARFGQDSVYATNITKNMMKAYDEGNFIGAGARVPFALIEQASRPIMDYLVPRMKLGAASDMLKWELENNPNMSHEELRDRAGKVWDSVDNRLGQLVYDNLFWNKVAKDLALATTRSVGWNLGTMRELVGGAVDAVRSGRNLAQGRDVDISHRTGYVLALPVLSGAVGAITQALLTWHKTGKAKLPGDGGESVISDLYYPRSGNIDEHGKEERLTPATYMKDVFHYYDDPLGTVRSKLHPFLNTMGEILSNRDFNNVHVREGDLVQQARDTFMHLVKAYEPFGVRGLRREKELGGDALSQALPFLGITRAPRSVTNTPAEALLSQYGVESSQREPMTKEEFERRTFKSRAVQRIRQGKIDEVLPEIRARYKSGALGDSDIDNILDRADLTFLVNGVKGLQYDKAVEVFVRANPKEREDIQETIIDKALNEMENKPAREAEIINRLRALGIAPK